MHFALPTHRSGCASIALPPTNASVPVSGHASTQLPQPMHKVALITGLGFPESLLVEPFAGVWTAARCKVHNDIGAPQDEQNVESAAIDFEQRGHVIIGVCAGVAGAADAA